MTTDRCRMRLAKRSTLASSVFTAVVASLLSWRGFSDLA